MELSPEIKSRLLARHQALISLVQYLEGDTKLFMAFLESTCQLEKSLEDKEDSSKFQCQMLSSLLTNAKQLKRVLWSQEWQQANEYFVVPSNEDALLDLYNRLELGNPDCKEEVVNQLRRKLLQTAFGKGESASGEARLGEALLQFVFSDKIYRFFLQGIGWEVEKKARGSYIRGKIVVSVGNPKPDGPSLYRTIFALCGDEKQAATIIGIRGLAKEDQSLQIMAKELLYQMRGDMDKMADYFRDVPANLQKAFQEWAQKDPLERECSPSAMSFLRESMSYLQGRREDGYNYLKDRLLAMGLTLSSKEESRVYDFSPQVAPGDIIAHQPTFEYTWPPEDLPETILPGYCSISAGPMPVFLETIYHFTEIGILEPRPTDVEAVKHLLCYIRLGEKKVSKPPILPVYNALRRWVESLSHKGEYKFLEKFCRQAQILRSFIQIPCVGKIPVHFPAKNHILLPKFAPDYDPGTIVGIKEAGLLVPSDKMPLALAGVYWVAAEKSPVEPGG